MKRRTFTGGIISTGTIAAASQRAFAADALTVATIPIDAQAQPYYAEGGGFFEAAGLSVSVVPLQNSSDNVAALVSNSAQIANVSIINIAEAVGHGVPLVIVAPGVYWNEETTRLIVAKDAPFKTAADLNGKTIGVVGVKNLATIAPQYWMDKNGGDSKSARFVEIPFPQMAAALSAKRIDAAFQVEPFLSLTKDIVRPIAPALLATLTRKPLQTAVWVSMGDWASANRRIVASFSTAMSKTAVWANANKAKTAALLAAATKMNADTAQQMARCTFATHLDAGEIQPLLDLALAYGALASPLVVSKILFRA